MAAAPLTWAGGDLGKRRGARRGAAGVAHHASLAGKGDAEMEKCERRMRKALMVPRVKAMTTGKRGECAERPLNEIRRARDFRDLIVLLLEPRYASGRTEKRRRGIFEHADITQRLREGSWKRVMDGSRAGKLNEGVRRLNALSSFSRMPRSSTRLAVSAQLIKDDGDVKTECGQAQDIKFQLKLPVLRERFSTLRCGTESNRHVLKARLPGNLSYSGQRQFVERFQISSNPSKNEFEKKGIVVGKEESSELIGASRSSPKRPTPVASRLPPHRVAQSAPSSTTL
ncbi:hypothetical protein C8R45DRAFT_941859 [Mycena sanguinolenta]|nr:hypothetical protein C8R45DRAFT_941859 [Mycena sanguinolenta]